MLSTATRLRLQGILGRISKGEAVSLVEMVYLNKFADRDPSVSNWLNKARHIQKAKSPSDGIDSLLQDLSLGSPDPESIYKPEAEDLGDWFGGAPSWVSRS